MGLRGPARLRTRASTASARTPQRADRRSTWPSASRTRAAATTAARRGCPARSGGARYREGVTEHRDPRVDEYIARLPDWQQAICARVRHLIHEADPEIEETIKRTVQPYFV